MPEDTQLPAEYDIEIVQGDDYLFDVKVRENGSPVDFTGHSNGLLQVRRWPSAPLLDEYLSSGDLTMSAGGRVTVDFPAADTAAWPQEVQYEFQTEDPSGDVQTYIEGTINVKEEVAE